MHPEQRSHSEGVSGNVQEVLVRVENTQANHSIQLLAGKLDAAFLVQM